MDSVGGNVPNGVATSEDQSVTPVVVHVVDGAILTSLV